MSQITRTYTFTDGTVAYGSQVESEISTIVTAWNNHDSGVTSWTAIKTSGDITLSGSGKGIICTTPNGLNTYKISVDNDGSIVTEQQS